MWKFLDVTIAIINRNDCSINKKQPHPTLIVIDPRIILRITTGSYIKKQPRLFECVLEAPAGDCCLEVL